MDQTEVNNRVFVYLYGQEGSLFTKTQRFDAYLDGSNVIVIDYWDYQFPQPDNATLQAYTQQQIDDMNYFVYLKSGLVNYGLKFMTSQEAADALSFGIPVIGNVAFDTTLQKLIVFNGSTWVPC